jgi:hypothetical protein
MNDERRPVAAIFVLAQLAAVIVGILAGVAVYNAVT